MAFKRRFRKRHIKKRFRKRFNRIRRPMVPECYKTKCTSEFNIVHVAADDFGSLSVGFNRSSNADTTLSGNAEYTALMGVPGFQWWRITGLKVRVDPIQFYTVASGGTVVYDVLMATDVGQVQSGSTYTNAELLAFTGSKSTPIYQGRQIKRYYSLTKYFKKTGNQTWVPANTNYNQANGGVIIRVRASGFGNGTITAKVIVDWYVQFKGYTLT